MAWLAAWPPTTQPGNGLQVVGWILTWLAEGPKVSCSWCWPAVGRGQGPGCPGWCQTTSGWAGSLRNLLWGGCGGPGAWVGLLVGSVGAQEDLGLVPAH